MKLPTIFTPEQKEFAEAILSEAKARLMRGNSNAFGKLPVSQPAEAMAHIRAEYAHRSARPPVVRFADTFNKVGFYRRTIFLKKVGQYVAVFRFEGHWNGRVFRQEFAFALSNHSWVRVHDYEAKWL